MAWLRKLAQPSKCESVMPGFSGSLFFHVCGRMLVYLLLQRAEFLDEIVKWKRRRYSRLLLAQSEPHAV